MPGQDFAYILMEAPHMLTFHWIFVWNSNRFIIHNLQLVVKSWFYKTLSYTYQNIIINNQVLRKIKIAVERDIKNWAYISLR